MGLESAATGLVTILVDATVKAVLLLVLVAVALRLMRRLSASLHSTILTGVALTLILLLPVSLLEPAWSTGWLHPPAPGATTRLEDNAAPAAASTDTTVAPRTSTQAPAEARQWPTWAMLIWVVGITVYAGWLLVGWIGLWWIRRHARLLDHNDWQRLAAEVAQELGVHRRFSLHQSQAVNMALTTGILRPQIILPAAADTWSEERRRLVLVHELAHIRRHDSLVELVARTATALHWFNPAVWLAMRQLRVERERACDNAVLRTGAPPSEYATQLMAAAAELGAFRTPLWQTAASSEGSSLKDRLLCILDPGISRSPAPRSSPLITAALTLLLALPLSAISLWSRHEEGRPAGPATTRASPAMEELSAEHQQPRDAPPTPMPTPQPESRPDWRRQSRVARLTRDLTNPDPQVRIVAAVRLREMHSPEAIPGLLQALDDSYDEVRITAVIGLGALDDPRTTEGLRRALKDRTERIRVEAVVELAKRSDRAAYQALIEATRNSSLQVRNVAREAVDRIERGE